MSDYIVKDAHLKRVYRWITGEGGLPSWSEFVGWWRRLRRELLRTAKPLVRCRDCKYGKAIREIGCILLESRAADLKNPDGFCAWGEPCENPCQITDENAAAVADAPTLKPAREPMQTPLLELGA